MPNLVKGEGPLDAKIVLIGEAPGHTENATGRPFMGASGEMLKQWWNGLGLQRGQVRIDNLSQYLPPKGKIANEDINTLVRCVGDLRQRIAELRGPCVVVPTGNYATFALTGKGKVKAALRKAFAEEVSASEAEKKAGITSLRGSVYNYTTLTGHQCKLIPTIHPSWFLHGNRAKQEIAIHDWKRIIRESESPNRQPRIRHHVIEPTEHQVSQYVKFVKYYQDQLSLSMDIETWGNTLSCVGFSHDPNYSITINTTGKRNRDIFLPYVRALCETSCAKILQNGFYDWYWLASYNIRPVNWHWDTLGMAHALNPIGQFTLEHLCSIHVKDYQYWKDEAKDAEEIRKYARDLQALWIYNGLDCCYTYELWQELLPKLAQDSRLQFYFDHYRNLFVPLLGLMLHGVAVDKKSQAAQSKELMIECQGYREQLEALAGEDLFATKDFSPTKLRKFFYTTLGIPKKTKWTKGVEGKKRTVTLDKHALNDFIVKAGMPKHKKKYEAAKEPALYILKFRRNKKKADTLKKGWDSDSRVRCSYKLTTESGRLASSKNPKRRGYNLQNPSRKIRDTFWPDRGTVFVKIDLSQVEDRMVKMYTGADRMVKMANLRPDELDVHTHNAAMIFGKSEADITYDERYLGKRTVHGAQRGMTGMMLSLALLADEDAPMVVSPGECQKMINIYLDEVWEIRDIYFPQVRKTLWREKRLVNSWGRVWDVGQWVEWNDDLYGRAFSWLPQSENADLCNQWGVLPAWEFQLRHKVEGFRVNLQVHDEIISSSPVELAYDYAKMLVDSLERPREINGNILRVPAGVTVASSWKDSRHEFKSLPPRSKFEEAAYAVADEVEARYREIE